MNQLLLAYGAGALTTLNPCVLPMIPFVLASSLREGRLGPLALVAGMALTFTVTGVGVAWAGPALGLTADGLRIGGAALLVVLGAMMVMPAGQRAFAYALGPAANQASGLLDSLALGGVSGQFMVGMLMGIVWSPCAGPTLFAALGLAANAGSLPLAAVMMLMFSLGAGTVMLLLAYGAQEALARRKSALMTIANSMKSILGYVFLALGLIILTGFDKTLEGALVSLMPDWLVEFTTRI